MTNLYSVQEHYPKADIIIFMVFSSWLIAMNGNCFTALYKKMSALAYIHLKRLFEYPRYGVSRATCGNIEDPVDGVFPF